MPYWILRMPHSIDHTSEVRRRKAEGGRQRSEVRGQRSGVRHDNKPVRGRMAASRSLSLLPTPNFRLPTSDLCLLPSALRPLTADFWRLSSALRFRLPRVVGRDELRVALLQVLVVDLLAPSHQLVSERYGVEVQFLLGVLKQDQACISRVLIFIDDWLSDSLKLGEGLFNIVARLEALRQGDRILDCELGARADREMRRVQRVAKQHDVLVMPSFVLHQRKVEPAHEVV